MTTSYNTRLQVSSFSVPGIMAASLSYYSDGRIHTERSTVDRRFDRAYSYDHTGRVIEALSGSQAGVGSTLTRPYHQSFQYDAFSNMSERSGRLWSGLNDSYATTYVNDRDQNWDYDAAGNPTTQDTLTAKFDTSAILLTGAFFGWEGDARLEFKATLAYTKPTNFAPLTFNSAIT
jgi:hypothetical protein